MRSFFHRHRVASVGPHIAPGQASKSDKEPNHKEKAPGDAFSGLPQATSAWLCALGVTAGLAATGFIGKLALQQFLGIELGNWTALDLSIFAGRWAIDTLTVLLDGLLAHPILFGVPILIYLSPTFVSFSFPLKDTRGQVAARISIVLATVGLIYALTWCEMPTLSMNNWLTVELGKQLDLPDPGLLKERESDLRLTLLVSKMDGIASQGSVCNKTGQNLPQALMPHLNSQYPAQTARSYLKYLYAACVVICLTSLFTLYFHQLVEEPRLIDDAFRAMRLFTSLVLLPLVACSVDGATGKAASSTDQRPPTPRVFVIDETDKYISLLYPEGSIPYRVEILHRDDIKSMQCYGEKDVLNTMLLQCNWLPP